MQGGGRDGFFVAVLTRFFQHRQTVRNRSGEKNQKLKTPVLLLRALFNQSSPTVCVCGTPIRASLSAAKTPRTYQDAGAFPPVVFPDPPSRTLIVSSARVGEECCEHVFDHSPSQLFSRETGEMKRKKRNSHSHTLFVLIVFLLLPLTPPSLLLLSVSCLRLLVLP